MDLSLIYEIDSITEENCGVREESSSSDSDDEFFIPEELGGNSVLEEIGEKCEHDWRVDYIRNNEVCVKCGITKKLESFVDGGEITETIAIESNQLSVKGIGQRMKRFYLWHESPSYIIKSFNEDLNTIGIICSKVGISQMIADDARLIYRRFKDIIGFKSSSKYLSKSSTKKQRIAMMEKFQGKDEDFKKQILFSNCRLRGDSKIGLLCACIFYACYKNGFCIICNVLAESANIKPKYVHKGCNVLLQIRDLNDDKLNMLMPVICMPYPIHYLKTVCDGFEEIIGKKIVDKQREEIKICLLNTQLYDLIVNHNPHSFAIGIVLLYLVSNKIITHKFSKKDIAKYFGICQPTINTTYKELISNKDKVFDYSKKEEELIEMIKNKKCEIDNERFKKFFEKIEANTINIDMNVINKMTIN